MSNGSIPRILHQTWKTERVPDRWSKFVESWQAHHPGWQYRLWTDEANRAFVAEGYPRLLETYDSYSYNIQRADAVRYCLLHHFGGVYADLDIECLAPLDELIEAGEFIAVREPAEQGAWLGRTSLLSNAFMAARPGHPFLAAVIESLIDNREPGLTHRDVLEITGPVMLDSVLGSYTGQDVTVLPSRVAFPFVTGSPELQRLMAGGEDAEALKVSLVRDGTFCVHYWANSWVEGLAGELVNPDPYSIAGYDFYPGVDSPGHDIANVGRDIRRAAAACGRMRDAVAFNTDGFVKDRLVPPDQWLPMREAAFNTGLYVKSGNHRTGILGRVLSVVGRRRTRRQ